MALSSGIRKRPDILHDSVSAADRKEFIRACHRGFDLAQHTVLELLREVAADGAISPEMREYRSLLLREVMDSIVYTLVGTRMHVLRRLVLHDYPPSVNLDVAQHTLKVADAMNAESRLTFAVVTDLTTSVHLGDILRIDRRGPRRFEVIELKSGKVNKLLESCLGGLPATSESLAVIESDREIPKDYKSQARRMQRQRLRLAQFEEVISHDRGTDPKFQTPIRLSQYTHNLDTYDDALDSLCHDALIHGVAAGTIDEALHLLAVNSTFYPLNRTIGALGTFSHHALRTRCPGIREIDAEITQIAPLEDLLVIVDPVLSNLYACPSRPVPLWEIDRSHLASVMDGALHIRVGFDVAAFVKRARSMGYRAGLSSRKEAASARRQLGPRVVPMFGNRLLWIDAGHGARHLMAGFLGRLVNDLVYPSRCLQMCADDPILPTSDGTAG